MIALKAKPFVKWAGGKRAILNELFSNLPVKINKYYEPFVGGGALFFKLNQSKACISDINSELITTYEVIKDNPLELIDVLKVHAENHNKTYFYEIRGLTEKTNIEIAGRFLYLNKTCFNGLYRVNKKGFFNSPIGNYKNPNIIQADNILLCSEALKNTDIKNMEFDKIEPQKGDFVYFDPPYDKIKRDSFISYDKVDFGNELQIRLRNFASDLINNGVNVMLSNSDTDFINDLYSDSVFTIKKIKVPRFINSDKNGRKPVSELLIRSDTR